MARDKEADRHICIYAMERDGPRSRVVWCKPGTSTTPRSSIGPLTATFVSDVRLIGRQGDNVYLVEVEPINGESMARVLDLAQKRLFPIAPLGNLLARGYWEGYPGKPGELERLLALVTDTPSTDSGCATRSHSR